MHPAAALALSYVAGSIPSAFLAGRWGGVNLREHGSGNLGATNVARVLGPRVGAVVFAADIAKGALPVWLLPPQTGMTGDALTWIQVACAVAAILGHTRPVFLGFGRGGKGVATACGVFLALAPLEALTCLLTFGVVVLASGYVSLGSMSGAMALPIVLWASYGVLSPLFYIGLVTTTFVFWTHRENIKRLHAGSEFQVEKAAKLGQRVSLAIAALVLAAATALLYVRAH